MSQKKGYVYLIGAGCGEKDFMTLRGWNCLQQCDAVVYDDLIDSALLTELPSDTLTLYMGKRKGKHSARQQEISDMLIQLAKEGRCVARLKGGDPFVFGRGGEEAMALQKAGIPFEEIPGISSCIAIPALAGIPVTHRGVSRSFHVVTAHTKDDADDFSEQMLHLAALDGTLVFLMGLSRLKAIADGLVQAGKAEDTPAAVVSGGNSMHPIAVRGTLADIADKARKAHVLAPAVIVVGNTAAMNLLDLVQKPLQGINVGLTGTADFVQKLGRALKKQGAQTTIVQQSRVQELVWENQLKRDTGNMRPWLVFTSAHGVHLFFAALEKHHVDLRSLAQCKFAVIGGATGEALQKYGFYADLCPDEYTSEALAHALCRQIEPGEEVVLLRAENSTQILPKLLSEKGIPMQQAALYAVKPDLNAVHSNLELLDYLTFASAGGVRQFFQEYGTIPAQTVCACIGEITAREFAKYDARKCLVAENASVEQMIQSICAHHEKIHP